MCRVCRGLYGGVIVGRDNTWWSVGKWAWIIQALGLMNHDTVGSDSSMFWRRGSMVPAGSKSRELRERVGTKHGWKEKQGESGGKEQQST